jgi:hypothetical protein
MPVQEVTPHDDAAERAVLGAVLRDAERALPLVAGLGLAAGDFYHHVHRLVYAGAADLLATGGPCGVADVYLLLRSRGELAELGPRPGLWLADVWGTRTWEWEGVRPWAYEAWATGTLSRACLVGAVGRVLQLARTREQIYHARELLRDAYAGHVRPRGRVAAV